MRHLPSLVPSRFALVAISILFVSFVLHSGPLEAADLQRPNFVVFLTDDQGWGDLGVQGHPRIQSPHLDRFATESVRLTQCYSSCGVCSPSRSAILTGRTPYRNGVWRWIPGGHEVHLRESEVTIAELLKEQGYVTCHSGKWHLNGHFNSDKQPQPDGHGFDHWFATQNNASPSHKNPRNFVRNGKEVGPLEGYSSLLVVDEAIRWLETVRGSGKPFFLNLWTHEPHLPIESAPEFMKPYADLDEGTQQHHGNITQLDAAFGRLMAYLEKHDLVDNTAVMYTADNGPEGDGRRGRTRGSTGGLRGRKRADYEGGIRVPGMFRWPAYFRAHGVKAGSASPVPVVGHDIFTTLATIAGAPIPRDRTIDGADFLPALVGRPIARSEPLYWRTHIAPPDSRAALRVGEWKVVANEDLSSFQLFHVEGDAAETTDLSEAFPQKFAEMRQLLIDHDAAVKKDGPDWWKSEPVRKRRRAPKISKGEDKTGDFQVTKGTVVTKSELGYRLEAGGEGFALKKLERPITKKATIRFAYRTLTNGTTKNAMLAFGDDPKNARLIKAGTAIGMGAHVVFRGDWGRLREGASLEKSFDAKGLFEAEVTIDFKERVALVKIGGGTVKVELPGNMNQITHCGFYVKATTSEFRDFVIE